MDKKIEEKYSVKDAIGAIVEILEEMYKSGSLPLGV